MNIPQIDVKQLTVEQYLVWLDDFSRENFKGDRGLALLELELAGFYD